MGICERCKGRDHWMDEHGRMIVSDFTDYCATCGKNLCRACMAKGCCKSVPAKSGQESDEQFQVNASSKE